jgi:multidrug efflux system membrane fusion protein
MGIKGVFWTVIIVAAAAAAYGAYAPEVVEKYAPAAAPYANRLHAMLPAAAQRKAADAAPAPTQPQGPAPILVSATAVKRADFPVVLESLGQVQAYNTVTVRARVDGQVVKIAFKEGQPVKAGDLLAQIDPRPFQAALDQSKAKKTQDEATLANAKLDLQRYATLAKQSYATQQQLDTQNALVSQLIAQIAADAAAIDAAQVQLDYTTIRAPITGRAGFRLVDEGNLVQASQQTGIVVIAQLQPISVIFTAPEDEVGKINALLTVEAPKVSVENTDGAKLATGKLAITDNQIDTTTGTIRLKAEFPNTDNALWPGLAVTTSLQVGIDKNAIVVPTAAIQHGQKGLYVYIVDDQNHAALRTIKVSHENTTVAVVSEGLKDGDRIVTSGQFLLQPGSAVTIDTSASGS